MKQGLKTRKQAQALTTGADQPPMHAFTDYTKECVRTLLASAPQPLAQHPLARGGSR